MFKKLFLTGALLFALTTNVFALGENVTSTPIKKLSDLSTTAVTGADYIPVYDASADKDVKVSAGRFVGAAGIVQLAPDVTTFDVGTGTTFYTGSNTTATAITDVTGGTVGQIFTLVTTGGANWTTIADSGNFNIAGSGGFAPDSADDSITFLIQADNDYVQIYGTQTNN